MTKKEFLDALSAKNSGISDEEMTALREYHSEMIDEMCEDGMTEEEAVAHLAKEKDSYYNIPTEHSNVYINANVKHSREKSVGFDSISAIEANLTVSELNIEPTKDTMGRVVMKCDTSNPCILITISHGIMTISEKMKYSNGHFNSYVSDITVYIPENITLDYAGIRTASGDVSISSINIGKIGISTASGDVTLTKVKSDTINVVTASGDFSLNGSECNTADFKTASGDIEISGAHFTNYLSAYTASGDVVIHNTLSKFTEISTATGDVVAEACSRTDYSIHTISGDIINYPQHPDVENADICKIKTVSGDIRFE